MNASEIVAGLMQELRRGTLILLVLSRLRQPMYGYSLVKALADGGIPIDANTLYPLLRRLEGQGLLESQWDTAEAKPRKYYSLTALGRTVLETATPAYHAFTKNVDALLEVTL